MEEYWCSTKDFKDFFFCSVLICIFFAFVIFAPHFFDFTIRFVKTNRKSKFFNFIKVFWEITTFQPKKNQFFGLKNDYFLKYLNKSKNKKFTFSINNL